MVQVEAVPKNPFQSYSTVLAGGTGGAGPEDLSPRVPRFGPLGLVMAVHPVRVPRLETITGACSYCTHAGALRCPQKALGVRSSPSSKATSAAGLGSPGHVRGGKVVLLQLPTSSFASSWDFK